MKRGAILFLKAAIILLGIPVLAFCVFVVPKIANVMVEYYPEIRSMRYLVQIGSYAPMIPFYFALHQALKLLSCIDRNQAFSQSSDRALRNIKYNAAVISILYTLDLPLFYLFAEKDDAPGVIIIGLIMIFASLVIAIFTGTLQNLLQKAIDIKAENDRLKGNHV